jgi:polyhydroxybutyrate depolymerase
LHPSRIGPVQRVIRFVRRAADRNWMRPRTHPRFEEELAMRRSDRQIASGRLVFDAKPHARGESACGRLIWAVAAFALWHCDAGSSRIDDDWNPSAVNPADAATSDGAAALPGGMLPGSTAGGGAINPAGSGGGTAGPTFPGGSGGTAGAGADAGSPRTGGTSGGSGGAFAGGGAGAGMGDAGAATSGEGGSPPPVNGEPAMPSAGCGMSGTPMSGSITIDVDGTQRQFVVKGPTNYDANKPYRLVLGWHGLGGTAMQTASSFFGLASRAGSAAVFIAGQALTGGSQPGLASWSYDGTDANFTRKLIEWAKTNYCIDEKRIFSIGVSNGGFMSNIIACQVGDLIRGMASIAGGGPKPWIRTACKGRVAAWITHGTADNTVPYSYGEGSRDQGAETNNCGTMTQPVMPGSCVEYQGCDQGYPVWFCEHGGGHTVPSFTAESAWEFFQRL